MVLEGGEAIKMKKTTFIIALGLPILVWVMVLYAGFTSGFWSNSTFNNSLGNEGLIFSTKGQTITRYLAVPQNTIVTSGKFNITYNDNSSYLLQHGVTLNLLTGDMPGNSWSGVKILVGNNPLLLTGVTKDTSAAYTMATIRETCAGNNISLANFIGNSANFTTPIKLNNNSVYYILGSNNAAYKTIYASGVTYPVLTNNFTNVSVMIGNIPITSSFNTNNLTITARVSGDTGCAGEDAVPFGFGFNNFLMSNVFSNSTLLVNSSSTQLLTLQNSINNYMSTCTILNNYCNVPFAFSLSSNSGYVNYSGLDFTSLGIYEISQNYSNPVYETSTNTFTLNMTYDVSSWLLASANFVYNNTIYVGNKIGTSSNLLFWVNVTAPIVNVNDNKTFYWAVALTNSTGISYFNSTKYNQTITDAIPILINSTCSQGLNNSLYFNFLNEINLTGLIIDSVKYNVQYGLGTNTGDIITDGTLTNTNNFSICINSSAPTYTISYGEIQYSLSGFTDRRYYLFSGTRPTTVLMNTSLYSLQNSYATSFLVQVQTPDLTPLSNYYVGLMRWYPDLNSYKIVEMAKTDEKGQTVLRVKTEDVDYRLAVYQTDGTLVKLLNPLRMVCLVNPCTYTISVDLEQHDYTSINGVVSSLTYNSTTKIFTFVWNDPSQLTSGMNLTIYKDTGADSIIICSVTGSSYTGIIVCDVTGNTGQLRAEVYRTASPPQFITSLLISIRNTLAGIGGGTFGLLMTLMLAVLTFLVGIFSPFAAILFGVLSLIPAVAFGGVSMTVFIGFAIMAGVVLHFIKRS